MQDRYVSLDPTYARRYQYVSDRQAVYRQRYLEAQGGPLAIAVGYLGGVTAGYWTYLQYSSGGFTFFPY